ncbi:MAG: hypothetical protein M1829_000243 [Trizodia sp. TS-e1964]|nr:MAG: hypothetical protein M1829_000243 [Trizodia sp. TS-e1964]
MKHEDTSWIQDYIPEWRANIYVVDDPAANLTVSKNKGHEAMVYLTFIIDNYHNLPETSIFIHSKRYQWHNDHPNYDSVPILKSLQIPYVQSSGYANLKCAWKVGCPNEIYPADQVDLKHQTQYHYANAYRSLFPNEPVPDVVAAGCCAQFAVSKTQILARPLADYEHYRKWLLDTEHNDGVSGRLFEFSWHIIFGKPAVSCPDPKICYCKTFGLCDLKCSMQECDGQYRVPIDMYIVFFWTAIACAGVGVVAMAAVLFLVFRRRRTDAVSSRVGWEKMRVTDYAAYAFDFSAVTYWVGSAKRRSSAFVLYFWKTLA